MPNVLISREIGSEWRTILGHPQLIECMGTCVLNLDHECELKGSDVYLHIVGGKIYKLFFKFIEDTCPWMSFAWNFFGIFLWGKSFVGSTKGLK